MLRKFLAYGLAGALGLGGLSACVSPAATASLAPLAPSPGKNAPLAPVQLRNAEDKALKEQLAVRLNQLSPIPLKEHPALAAIALEHADQIALDTINTGFKVQTYNPVPASPLMTRILQSRLFPSQNLFNAFFSANDAEEALSRFSNQVKGNLSVSPFSHYGIGVIKGAQQWFVTVILVTEIITLEGLEIELDAPGTRQIVGQLVNPGYSRPSALVTLPSGAVESVALQSDGARFGLSFPFADKGYYSFEINVEGPFGPEPATNFVVAVGVPRQALAETSNTPAPEIPDLAQARQKMLELINRDRAEVNVGAVLLDETVSQAAQGHSEDMVANGFIGHNSPTKGTPQQQVNKAGVSESAAQNIAASRSLENAQAELMSSPGHRKLILEPDFTHVGLGVKRSPDGFLYVTQDFIRRKFELDRLPDFASPGTTIQVKGKVAERKGFLAIFLNSNPVTAEPIDLTASGTFAVPVPLPALGTAKIQIGFSDGPVNGSFNFKFFNVWEIQVK